MSGTAAVAAPWPRLAPVALTLALGFGVLGVLFRPEEAAAIGVWQSSTAYGHCWLVLPIVAWLLWERRELLHSVAARPCWWSALLGIPLALGWVAADFLGIMEGRQFALLGFFEVLLLAVLGWRLWWALSPALLYAVFLVPFGAFITPALQHFTANFIDGSLSLLGVPHHADIFRIEIPEGVFYVAEACAGLRFLIASIAFGALYAVTMFTSPVRRLIYIAACCVVPVVANGVRGLGIVLLGHALGSAQAGAADHIIYGWVFFSAVILVLAAAGLPFRQDIYLPRKDTPAASAPGFMPAILVAMPVILVAFAGPALGVWLDRLSGPPGEAIAAKLVLQPGCVLAASQVQGAVSLQQIACGAHRFTVTVRVLPQKSNPAAVLAAARASAAAALGADLDSGVLVVPGGAPAQWVLLTDRNSHAVSAFAIWVDGAPGLGGVRDRARLAADMLRGSAWAPVAVAVSLTPGEDGSADILTSFLAAQTNLAAAIEDGAKH